MCSIMRDYLSKVFASILVFSKRLRFTQKKSLRAKNKNDIMQQHH